MAGGGSARAEGDASDDSKDAVVDFREVSVAYHKKKVFDGLSWTVLAGEKWVVVGNNGSGKSTLLELITGDNLQVLPQVS